METRSGLVDSNALHELSEEHERWLYMDNNNFRQGFLHVKRSPVHYYNLSLNDILDLDAFHATSEQLNIESSAIGPEMASVAPSPVAKCL